MDMKNLNGFLMSRDTVTAEIKNGRISEIICENLLLIYIKHTRNLSHWLKKRAIDSHRTNSRLLKKALRLADRDDLSTVLSVNGVTMASD